MVLKKKSKLYEYIQVELNETIHANTVSIFNCTHTVGN